MSIEATKKSFEESFKETTFYNKQTQDESHLRDILNFVEIDPQMKVDGLCKAFSNFPIEEIERVYMQVRKMGNTGSAE